MSQDSAIANHQKWLGFLQPEGLVVSAAALSDAGVLVELDNAAQQREFLAHVIDTAQGAPTFTALPELFSSFLGWPGQALLCGAAITDNYRVPMPEFGETLAPDFVLTTLPRQGENTQPQLLIQELPSGTDMDARTLSTGSHWSASANQRMERLLRETHVPIGLLCNGSALRLIYLPRGENPGSITFPISAMRERSGRVIVSALHSLLGSAALFTAPTSVQLPSLLKASRDYQARVSGELSEQVLDALYELVRGFQAADARSKQQLLASVLARDPQEIYRGLLTVLMRLVFLLFAEDRALLPQSALYFENYSVHGLYARLRSEAERYPDTMDQRFGGWAQLLVLFNLVHQGCRWPDLAMPARRGYLFDPARFAFLQGSAEHGLPLLADGVLLRVLTKLIMLGGEKLSYRTLDVEQIGSVYETMMGFSLLQAKGLSVALKPAKAGGAPIAIDLSELLAKPGKARVDWLKQDADQNLPDAAAKAIQQASTVETLLSALEKRIATRATPAPIAPGGLLLQPNDVRRKQGSHYTPRALTEPVVRRTLAPVLEQLGENPTPTQLLALKVCDPAMGSGAFLVEATRQLADALVKSWHAQGQLPEIPPDEDEVLHARRLVAQRCIYGVDRNPMAVDLAKLSLWLATLAKEHPFTFLDHAFREGDALVGLTRRQILDFDWLFDPTPSIGLDEMNRRIEATLQFRLDILNGGDALSPEAKKDKLGLAEQELGQVRDAGDLVLSAFFSSDNAKARKRRLKELHGLTMLAFRPDFFRAHDLLDVENHLADAQKSLVIKSFHWEIEFPEVFSGTSAGFDAIVGNPPFAGKNTLINGNRSHYLDWLQQQHEEAHGNADLVAHFFRRAFNLLRPNGCLGLIATNTLAQGDTRSTGLRWICTNGGQIYHAKRRYKWPGLAAVIVSQVHIQRGEWRAPRTLDGRMVDFISAYLFHAGGHEDPATLASNAQQSFQGSVVLGMGFTFDDTDKKGLASPLSEMHRLIEKDPRNAERIFPYLGGEEINTDPAHAHHRFVINFGDMPLKRDPAINASWKNADADQRKIWLRSGLVPSDYSEPVAADWPDLLAMVEAKVKPERDKLSANPDALRRKKFWWHFGRNTPALNRACERLERVIAIGQISARYALTSLTTGKVFDQKLIVFTEANFFATLHSSVHEGWAKFFGSTLKDDFTYTPTSCFETFPFPEPSAALADISDRYLHFRAELMLRNNQGLTQTYNRFHDPHEFDPAIAQLRALHAEMDSAVLDAYGWQDVQPVPEFLLDYDDDADEPSNKRKKPYRLRWPDAQRDEVLARLLALNGERYQAELRAGKHSGRGNRRTLESDDDS